MKSSRILLSERGGVYIGLLSLLGDSIPAENTTQQTHQPPNLLHLVSLPSVLILPPILLTCLLSCFCWWKWKEAMALAMESKFHVLAVDDSLIDRKLIERLLKTSSYQVTTVDSGSKALEVLGLQGEETDSTSVASDHEIEVSLVITDYCMPGMTGYDLLKKIKESSALKDIPVVIMSSENVPSRINRCLEEGAEEFLLKPVQLSDMKRLRPHILKGKSKEQQKPSQPPPLPPIQGNNNTTIQNSNNISSSTISNSDSSNKRKAMEEGFSPERTRARFSSSSLTVV